MKCQKIINNNSMEMKGNIYFPKFRQSFNRKERKKKISSNSGLNLDPF